MTTPQKRGEKDLMFGLFFPLFLMLLISVKEFRSARS